MPVSLRSRSSVAKANYNEQKIKEEEGEQEQEAESPKPKRRAKIKEEIASPPPAPASRNVEEIRRKNLEDNKAFLEELLMTKIRDDFKSSSSTLQPTAKKETKKRDVKYITVSENVPVRRSRRLANLDTQGNKMPTPEESDEEEVENKRVVVKRVYKVQATISLEEQVAINEKIKTIFDQEERSDEETSIHYKFSDLHISDDNVVKLTPDRLIAMDIHSRSDAIAIIGCDRRGTISLIAKTTNDLQGLWAKVNYNFHSEYATCCYFDRFQSHCIHSTSYDATLRSCDITKHSSTEIYKQENGQGLMSFDYFSYQTLLVSDAKGDVLRLDMRSQISADRYNLSNKMIRCVHVNPNHPEEFCISGTDSCVKVFDLRQMSKIKYCLDTEHACYGAYYNLSGSHIMATSRDDHLLSFSCDDMVNAKDPENILPSKKTYYRTYVHRFVTPFRAQPYLASESNFIIGTNDYPRSTAIIDENCKKVASLTSENLNSLASLNVAHRTLPVIVAGNSGGRIHVFTGQI